jgi:protein-disulfide isomerase
MAPEEVLPGVPLESLSEAQRLVVASWAKETFCYCGAPHTVSQCLRTAAREGPGNPAAACVHGARMARLAVRLAGAGAGASVQELGRQVTDYYASFEAPKRARIDVTSFGPPLGEATAKVTLVEFSDFTCPFCAVLRPQLEKFVEDRAQRVRLFYKPFPIESHPGALEAAQAAEWAREQGIFWPFHDKLFGAPHASIDVLGDWASELGKDREDLAAALTSGRLVDKVRGSQAEARDAGLRATPTIFVNRRRLVLPDLSDWMLEFTIQDEEEWLEHGGWARD